MPELTAHELLTTTRAVRKRLDFTRQVPRELLIECLETALQAPQGSNDLKTEFMVIDDPGKIEAIGELYHEVYEEFYLNRDAGVFKREESEQRIADQNVRVQSSVRYLAENFGRVPAVVIPCSRPRLDSLDVFRAKARLATIHPTIWNFMLAARLRGLGTCWTGMTLCREKEVAELLRIPYEDVEQVAAIPIAYTIGGEFKPATRPPASRFLRWNSWTEGQV